MSLKKNTKNRFTSMAKFIYSIIKKIMGYKLAFVGLLIILTFFLISIAAPYLAPNDPEKAALIQKLTPPCREYPLGTDHLGRCILSRIIYGTRISLTSSFLILIIIVCISIPVATISGYIGGKIDNFIMRCIDVLLAFPSMLLAIVIAGFLGPSLINTIVAIASVWWSKYVRIIRGMVLSIKEKDFIIANKACGTSTFAIITRHVIPNILSPIIVLVTLDMGNLILLISGLSFLGLGAQPPTPEWGAMMSDGRAYIQIAPTLMAFPGIAIMLITLAFNLLGEGLRDALDIKNTSTK